MLWSLAFFRVNNKQVVSSRYSTNIVLVESLEIFEYFWNVKMHQNLQWHFLKIQSSWSTFMGTDQKVWRGPQVVQGPYFVGHCSKVLVSLTQESLLWILGMELFLDLKPLFFHLCNGPNIYLFLIFKVNLKANKITLEISFDLSFLVP